MATETPNPAERLFRVIGGYWTSRAVYAAARLGLADLVDDGPKTAEQLAEATGTHSVSLYRLLRALAGIGMFAEDEAGRFAQTPFSAVLRSDVPGSLRGAAIAELGEDHYEAWGHLLHGIKTGDVPFLHRYGLPVWDFYASHPENAAFFHQAMTGLTAAVEAAVMNSYDFTPFRKIVDVGGGHGGLLASVLAAAPQAHGVLFDRPNVAQGGAARLRGVSDLAGRWEAVGGDFFAAVPEGGDLYLMKWILHDWDDARAGTILGHCRRALAPGGRVLIADAVLPGRNEPSMGKFMDLNMLVIIGGRERTEDEFRDLLAASGLRLSRVIPTESVVSLIEAVPVVGG
jgi:hypothetical protein